MVIAMERVRGLRFPGFLKAKSPVTETREALESRLLAAYQAAHRVYALKVGELERASSRHFADLLEEVEDASRAVETARAALDACRPTPCRRG